MPSPEAIKAMERIARDKADLPEGRVAAKKLARLRARRMRPGPSINRASSSQQYRGTAGRMWINGVEVGYTSFRFDMTQFQRASDDLAYRIRVAMTLATRMGDAIDEELIESLIKPMTKGS